MLGLLRHPLLSVRTLLAAVAAGLAPVAAEPLERDGEGPGMPEASIASSLPPLLADPAGLRSELGSRGVTFAVNYIGQVFGNPTGGFAQGTYYNGLLELAVAADLEKSIGWPGLTFFANAYQIHGQSITAEDLGVLMPVSFIEALPDTRLFELWLEQKLWNDRLSIRFGQLSAESDFMNTEGGEAFLNATWGWPSIAGINLPDGGPSYPMASPGVRIAFTPAEDWRLKAGLYTGDPAEDCAAELPQVCNPNGLAFPFSDPLLFLEGAYSYRLGESALAGTVKLGAWRLFSVFQPESFGTNALPIALPVVPGELATEDWALYGIIDQMLYRVPGSTGHEKGISVFGRVITAPPHGNMLELYWGGGFTFAGLSDARPDDIFGIGIAYSGVSSHVSRYQEEIGDAVIADFELMLEASYIAEIVPGFYLQPDFQYFWNPGGRVDLDGATPLPNAAVFGLSTTINY